MVANKRCGVARSGEPIPLDVETALGVRRPAAVLFDMDGTLVDSEKVWDVALLELAALYGGTLSAEATANVTG